LRQAKNIEDLTESSIEFTVDLGEGDQACLLYLFHEDDPGPHPPYTEEYYQLRYACGDTSRGSGPVLAENILQPERVPFSQEDSLITIDLTVSRNDAPVRLRSKVRLRNL
jgi:hypothetical protein